MMKSTRVEIEYIQNHFPFRDNNREFVVVLNGSNQRYDLKGWKLIYEELSTGTVLHTHHFSKLIGSFDPGERLCVMTGKGSDRFVMRGKEPDFSEAHWDLFVDLPTRIMNIPGVRVRLIDNAETILDTMTVECVHADGPTQSGINVFIGHGRNPQWRNLKDHLQEMHGLKVTAYEMGPRAGQSVKDVLQKLLSEASFAVLVLTGEDVHSDGEAHARENVVHELGLFQGRFGFTRAIALLEEGVKEFSNIHGINQIRFSKENIRESFGDILATLRREFKSLR